MRARAPVAMAAAALAVVLLLATQVASQQASGFDPVANPKAVVRAGNARFTVLTPQIIRMEWSASKSFQDAATWAFIVRNTPVPDFKATTQGDITVITTKYLELRYYTPSPVSFNATNLQVTIANTVNGQSLASIWKPVNGSNSVGNLFGTLRTLDGALGALELDCANQGRDDLHCTYGLVSTAGYAVVDDTHAPYYDNSPWPWIVPRKYPQKTGGVCAISDQNKRDCGHPGISNRECADKGCCMASLNGVPGCYYSTDADQDLYIFGHGRDFKTAMAEFRLVGGVIPVPPRYSFGVYYSRYWAYNDIGQMDVVQQYEDYDVPMDTLVTDMDWHITYYKEADAGQKDQAGLNIGWSGFTWDPRLFPDPKAFLDWCKVRGLKNTLNVHPASGIQPWEERYVQMANAMGIDPATKRYVPFNITDIKFTTLWNQIVLAPLEKSGIDFWWLDWQQGEAWIDLPGVNPTFWLNYVFFTNPDHWKDELRPHLLHRWGGLGNHRYQTGFSGDVVPSWESLAFQPYFTSRATNVGYSYWSHDLGGHTQQPSAELYTRWVQWGAFSPVFRTHCTKNADNDRRIWTYPLANFQIMRSFIQLRAALVPYIYTQARLTYETGLGMLALPMYYQYPNSPEAYTFAHQYFFGNDFISSPVAVAVDPATGLAPRSTWLPEGGWVDVFKGKFFAGPTTVSDTYTLAEMPLFVRAGAVIPMVPAGPDVLGQAALLPTTLKWSIHLSPAVNSGTGRMYEDDGATTRYLKGQFAWTQVDYSINGAQSDNVRLVIQPVQNPFPGQPSSRSHVIALVGVLASQASVITVNGKQLSYVPFDFSSITPSRSSSGPSTTSLLHVGSRDVCATRAMRAGARQQAQLHGGSLNDTAAGDSWTYDGNTLTLIITLCNRYPIANAVEINAKLSGSTRDPRLTAGFAGQLSRFVSAKYVLDNQWGTGGQVYQEDYNSLLQAAEIGQVISYDCCGKGQALVDPSKAIDAFNAYRQAAIKEVQALARLAPAVKTQLLAQLQAQ